ncbi:DUF1801 domain-containing protein [bacterium]|nr:DUF1801 domain-containing protein [bacterium]
MKPTPVPETIDDYIAGCDPAVQPILQKIRELIHEIAPEAEERISYRMPAFFQDGVLMYFAAFKEHIGIYPPLSGDEKLLAALTKYQGPKGNLKFPLDQKMPYPLIQRVIRRRLQENREKAAKRRRKAK